MMRFWDDTLLEYLQLANEDERVVAFVSRKVIPLVAKLKGRIDWLEVGPGPGTKTLSLLRGLESRVASRLGTVQLLEPCSTWRAYLHESQAQLFQNGRKGQVLMDRRRFEQYAKTNQASQHGPEPNFLTAFHVFYEPSLIDLTVRYLKRRAETGSPLVACVLVESAESDFFRLRLELASLGFQVPSAAAVLFEQGFEKAGVAVTASTVNTQFCSTASHEHYREWLLAFLLGCSHDALATIPADSRTEANRFLTHYIRGKRSGYLTVPDVAFTISTG